MNIATSFQDREALIWCALTATQSTRVKDPVAYINKKAKRFGPLLKEAVGLTYNWIFTECYAVVIERVDEALCAKHGWKTIQQLRAT